MQHIKEELRRRIIEVAFTEFDEKGYEGASMRNIAEGAGTSLGNLYRYFRNKDDMYVSCLLPVVDSCVELTGQIFDVSEQAIEITASEMAHYVSKHSREFSIIVRGPAKHYTEFLDRFTDCIADRLKHHAGEAGCTAVHNPDFFDAVALAFISGLRVVLEKSHTEEDTAAYILELMRFLFTDFDKRVNGLKGGAK